MAKEILRLIGRVTGHRTDDRERVFTEAGFGGRVFGDGSINYKEVIGCIEGEYPMKTIVRMTIEIVEGSDDAVEK